MIAAARTMGRMAAPTVDVVRAALARVMDPEIRRPITDLGMVRSVDVADDGGVVVGIDLTTAGCPLQDTITRDVKAQVAALDGVTSVEVAMGVMTDEQKRDLRTKLRGGTPEPVIPFTQPGSLTRVYAIASGKGGVGKSSVTANLAVAMAAEGLRVGVLDADVYGFSIPGMLGVTQAPTRVDDMILPVVTHGVKVISIGMFVPPGTPVVWRGPMLHRALQQFLADVFWGDLDVLLLDLPPGTGDIAISVAQLLPNSEIIVVTTPQAAASQVAERAGAIALQTHQQLAGVIENMSWLEQADGTRLEVFGSGGGAEVAANLTRVTGAPVTRVRFAATSAPPPEPNTSRRVPSACSSQDMFSITPASCWWVCRAIAPARSATCEAAACGVVTTMISEFGNSCATEIAMSPVPGGRSSRRTSRSPQNTSARNCCSARCSIGPRHTTGVPGGTNIPIEMTFTPCATTGRIMSSTRGPSAAIATARFAVTEDLPTPPLPDAIAYTRVRLSVCVNGMTGSGVPPRSWVRSSLRCFSDITPISTRTPVTPSRALAAAVTSLVRVSLSGHPAVVRSIPTTTPPSSATSTERTIPRSVIGRRISGSMTRASAARTTSTVGAAMRPIVRAAAITPIGTYGPQRGPGRCGAARL